MGISLLELAILRFQSTHPCGVRLTRIYNNNRKSGFNPRTPAGCDFGPICIINIGGRVSIHAPLRGATTREVAPEVYAMSFQSTHPCGVRLMAA